jgi:type-F conjugative transfer system pilin assembly protein TrbC
MKYRSIALMISAASMASPGYAQQTPDTLDSNVVAEAQEMIGSEAQGVQIPVSVSEDVLKQAEAMMDTAQTAMDAPEKWGLRDSAEDTLDSITIPKGEWPLSDIGIPEPGDYPYNLYVLVSANMPEGLLRTYANDAMQAGATLYVRGIEPEETIQESTMKWSKLAVRGDGASPGVSIDPRPFTAFDVKTVPAIVLAKAPIDELCDLSEARFSVSKEAQPGTKTLPFQTCMPAPDDSFYKITGNVSVPWALRRMGNTSDIPVLQKTASAWFSVMPDRYGVEPDKFGWANKMTKEDFSEMGDKDAMRGWLENVRQDNPELEVIETDAGLGLGVRGSETQ